MVECGASLVDEMEYPADASLLPLVQLQQMAEEHQKNLCVARGNIQSREEVQRIQMHLNAFRIQLDNWKTALSPTLQQSTIIQMASQFASIHVHQMDLINPFAKKADGVESKMASKPGSFSSSIRLDILLVCLDATKRLCEGFVALPTEEYRHISFGQWSAVIYATVVLYKFSIGLPQVPEWDVSVARNALSIEMFLRTLYSRMYSISGSDPVHVGKKDLFSMMGPIYENVKQTYDRLKQLPQSESAKDTNPVHATCFSDTVSIAAPIQTFQHRCPAFPFWKSQSSDVSLFDGVEGLPVGHLPVNTAIGDTLSGFDFVGEDEFWGATMPEPTTLSTSSGWSFPSY